MYMFVHNSYSFFIGQARGEEPEDIITDGSLNCRFKTSKADAHALGVCPAVSNTFFYF